MRGHACQEINTVQGKIECCIYLKTRAGTFADISEPCSYRPHSQALKALQECIPQIQVGTHLPKLVYFIFVISPVEGVIQHVKKDNHLVTILTTSLCYTLTTVTYRQLTKHAPSLLF